MNAVLKRSPRLVGRMPFYSYPRAKFVEMIEPLAWGIRTLPDAQLAIELEQLVETCSSAGHHLADRLMLRLYQQETARRADPNLRYDAELDFTLTQIEDKTNRTDREIVADIGRRLFAVGGDAAMRSAFDRMLPLARPAKRGVRENMLTKLWAGIGTGR